MRNQTYKKKELDLRKFENRLKEILKTFLKNVGERGKNLQLNLKNG